MSTVVIDASVALRWILSDEGDRAGAERLERALRSGRVEAVVPPIFAFEVAAALERAVVRRRIEAGVALAALDAVAGLGFETDAPGDGAAAALRIALDTGSRVPDATYVDLARRRRATLITADERQLAVADRLGVAAVALTDIPESLPR